MATNKTPFGDEKLIKCRLNAEKVLGCWMVCSLSAHLNCMQLGIKSQSEPGIFLHSKVLGTCFSLSVFTGYSFPTIYNKVDFEILRMTKSSFLLFGSWFGILVSPDTFLHTLLLICYLVEAICPTQYLLSCRSAIDNSCMGQIPCLHIYFIKLTPLVHKMNNYEHYIVKSQVGSGSPGWPRHFSRSDFVLELFQI